MNFHVGASTNNNIPGGMTDNMAGPLGSVGTTAYRLMQNGPDTVTSSGPGQTHYVPVDLCNTGNVPARLAYSINSSRGQRAGSRTRSPSRVRKTRKPCSRA